MCGRWLLRKFYGEMLYFDQFAKIFTRKSFRLHGTLFHATGEGEDVVSEDCLGFLSSVALAQTQRSHVAHGGEVSLFTVCVCVRVFVWFFIHIVP